MPKFSMRKLLSIFQNLSSRKLSVARQIRRRVRNLGVERLEARTMLTLEFVSTVGGSLQITHSNAITASPSFDISYNSGTQKYTVNVSGDSFPTVGPPQGVSFISSSQIQIDNFTYQTFVVEMSLVSGNTSVTFSGGSASEYLAGWHVDANPNATNNVFNESVTGGATFDNGLDILDFQTININSNLTLAETTNGGTSYISGNAQSLQVSANFPNAVNTVNLADGVSITSSSGNVSLSGSTLKLAGTHTQTISVNGTATNTSSNATNASFLNLPSSIVEAAGATSSLSVSANGGVSLPSTTLAGSLSVSSASGSISLNDVVSITGAFSASFDPTSVGDILGLTANNSLTAASVSVTAPGANDYAQFFSDLKATSGGITFSLGANSKDLETTYFGGDVSASSGSINLPASYFVKTGGLVQAAKTASGSSIVLGSKTQVEVDDNAGTATSTQVQYGQNGGGLNLNNSVLQIFLYGDTIPALNSTFSVFQHQTSGTLTGAFSNAPDGTTITTNVNGTETASFRVNYTSNNVVLTRVATQSGTAPTVSSPTATSITSTSAVLGGNVSSDGGNTLTKVGVLYAPTSTNGNPQLGGTGVVEVDKGTASTGVFTVNSQTLTAGTGYSYVAFATNGINTTYSSVGTFTTLAAPTVTSPTATGITGTGATLGGNVTSNGGSTLTKVGVLYAVTTTNGNPQLGGTGVVEVDKGSATTGIFTVSSQTLTAGTGYSYVAFATNGVNTTYTSVATFTTLAAPTVTSPTATGVTGTGATLGGNVTSNGGSPLTKVGVLYAVTTTNGNPQLGGTGVVEVDKGTATIGVFTVSSQSLTAGTGYSYVAFATNGVNTTYTSVATFTTLAAPTVTSPTSTGITSTGAILGGNVTSDGGSALTTVGVLYAVTTTNGNPQLGGTGVVEVDKGSATTGIFTVSSQTLTTGTGYSYVAFATNGVNTTYTSVGTFTTLSAPTVTSPTSTGITSTGATLGGNVTSDGGSGLTKVGVLYAVTTTNGNPQLGGTGVVEVDKGTATTGVFTVNSQTLTHGTGYSFVAFATNGVGTTYSSVSTFSAQAVAPTVTTPTATNITTTTATLGGDVTDDGGSSLTAVGILYSLTSDNVNPQLGGTGVTNLPGTVATGVFTLPASNLTPGAGYSYVAYATNGVDTSYSPVATFTMGANRAPTVATAASTPASPITATSANLSVLGDDLDTGEASLNYTWSTTGTPPAAVSYSDNGTNTAKNTTATFTASGTYNFLVTISDPNGAGVTSAISVIVNAANTHVTSVNNSGAPIAVGEKLDGPINSLDVVFSFDMDATNGGTNSVTNAANWALTRYGATVANPISSITYNAGLHMATLLFTTPLTEGGYQLIGFPTMHDALGGALIGDANGSTPSANFMRNFFVTQVVGGQQDVAPVLYGTSSTPAALIGPLTTAIPSNVQVFDADSTPTWASATVQITSGYQNGQDVLGFTNFGNITGSWDASTGRMTLTGADTLSNYRAAMQSVTYHNTSNTPNTAATRTVSYIANDGLLASNTVTSNFTVRANSGSPSLTGLAGTATFVQHGSAVLVAPGLILTHPDNLKIASATVTFTGLQTGDQINFSNIRSLQHAFVQNGGTGTLTLTGNDTAANYQSELRTVTFLNVAGSPNTTPRTATFAVFDILNNTASGSQTVNVTRVNQAPVLSSIESTAVTYAANHPEISPVPITASLLVTDADSATLSGATVQITTGYQHDVNSADVLAFKNQLGITGSFDATTGTLTLSGTASGSSYRTALRAVTFSTSGTSVNTTTRTITISVADDQSLASNPVTRNVAVTGTNASPTLSGLSSTSTYTSKGNSITVAQGLTVADSDSAMLFGATMTFTNWQSEDRLTFVNPTPATGAALQHTFSQDLVAHTATFTLSGMQTVAQYQAALQAVKYSDVAGNPILTARGVSITVNDGFTSSAAATSSITVQKAVVGN